MPDAHDVFWLAGVTAPVWGAVLAAVLAGWDKRRRRRRRAEWYRWMGPR